MILYKGNPDAAMDAAFGDPVFAAWHQLERDVSPKAASVNDHVKNKSKDFSTALAAQQPIYLAKITQFQYAIDHRAQLSATLRSGVAAAVRSATGVPTDADTEALRNAGLITATGNGSGGASRAISQFLFCSPHP